MGNPRAAHRGVAILSVVLVVLAITASVPARAQSTDCLAPSGAAPETYGPTDISAVSGNQELSAALNPDGTVTLFRWPSPSYYDQIKYRTTDRSEPRLGTLPNEGAFIGIASKVKGEKWQFDWLRQWTSRQRFSSDDSDTVVTRYRKAALGLTVRSTDVVTSDAPALVRSVKVTRAPDSPVGRIRVIAFANFNPVFSKMRQSPLSDWCTEEQNDDGASYVKAVDAIVHERSGTDASTGEPVTVATMLALASPSDGHEVGEDTYEVGGSGLSAYDDAADGKLSGHKASDTSQADAALMDEMRLRRGRSRSIRVIMAAGPDLEAAEATVDEMRASSTSAVVSGKRAWWDDWLSGAAVPQDAPASVDALARRALISLRQATDPDTGMVVASVATQSPLNLDWIRDGAYVNAALQAAGHPEMVRAHNIRYAQLQATSIDKPLGGETTPAGNWSQNYYADGVVGGSIPYEIDETGLGIWTLWSYESAADPNYLDSVYGAIQRAAHYLSDDPPLGCTDPSTGLQCVASEGDNANPTRTIVGAQAAWLGLDAAAEAATTRGTEESLLNAVKWSNRRDELGTAIDSNFFDDECQCYTTDPATGGTLLWPVGFLADRPALAEAQADQNWAAVSDAIKGKLDIGGDESQAILGNAYVWAGDTDGTVKLRQALKWIAEVPTTDETGLLGDAWTTDNKGRVITMVSQPHVPNMVMFYLAALQTYGSDLWRR